MDTKRWKRGAGLAGALILAYAALGFWVTPWLLQRQVASFAQERLHRQASIGTLHFNPFTLRLEAGDVRLAEADGSPLVSLGRLVVEMQWRSIVTGAWRFAEIELTEPKVNAVIAPDGRLNLSDLADSFSSGSEPSKDQSLPRLVINRFAVSAGAVELKDRHAAYANSFAPIGFELANFSTLPERDDTHLFTAQSQKGGKLRWAGRASVNPIRATGELVLEGVSLPELSVYFKSMTRATIAAGKLSATVPYAVSYADGKLEARLNGAKLAMQDFALVREGKSDSFASLTQFAVSGIDADLVKRDITVADMRAGPGKLTVRRDAKGELDIANLMIEAAGPAAAPPARASVQAKDWTLAVTHASVEQLAVSAVDETLNPPLQLDVEGVALQLGAKAAQRAAQLDVKLDGGQLLLSNLSLKKGSAAPVKLARLGFEGASLDLAARRATLERVFAEGGQLKVSRDRSGNIDLAGWVPKPGKESKDESTQAKPATPWVAQARVVDVGKFDVELADEQTGIKLHLADARAKLEGAGTDMKLPVKFDASVAVREGGKLASQGQLVPATGAVQAQVKVDKLSLAPLQPLLSQHLKLKIAGGSFTTQGKVATGGGARGKPAVRYDGSFDVAGLVLNEIDNDLFAAWQNVGAAQFTATVSPNRLEMPELRINGADAKLIIEDDRSFNAARLLVNGPQASPTPAAPVASAPATTATAATATPAPAASEPFPINIRRVRIQNAKLDFTDLSLRPQFGAKIHELSGVVNGLSSSSTARSQVELDGRVDEFGLARIRGELNPFAPKNNTDLNVDFRNVDMVAASPYTMKFAGYRIAEGKISLDLQYKIRDSKLEGDNKIVIDKLTLGERVDSPDAMKIPLQLAIAILKDSDGRIDLGLPVSGDLNDPQFSYGSIIWKAIGNVLTKIVTAPFRALGAMMGISGDKLESITFDAGSGKLLPPEREKLKQVAQLMAKRDGLKLTVPGQYNTASDGAALRAQAVRREIASRAGIQVAAGEEPGPLDTGDRAVRSAMRALYAQRFGDGELDKAKKAAETASPASGGASPASGSTSAGASQPAGTPPAQPTSQALPLWQRVGKMVQGEPQVADASAFYTAMRERLEREQPLAPDALKQLGAERAKVVVAALAEAKVDAARVVQSPPEADESPAARSVPLKLGLAAR